MDKKRKSALATTKNLAFVAIAVALNAVCAWIAVPFAIPFTMQTFGVFFTILFLGGKLGALAIAIYLALGLVGVPVFSGFNAGIPALMGATGGYLLGFLTAALLHLLLTSIFKNQRLALRIASCSAGLLLCYTIGTVWFAYVYSGNLRPDSLLSALTLCVFPYILPDIAKLSLALLLSSKLKKHLNPTS